MSRLDERPWFKFRVDRWLGDVELQSCTPAAQGIWINLLALMHGAKEYGHLLTSKGVPATVRDVAKMLPRISMEQIAAAIQELTEEGVCSVRADGCIYSRRMVRDYAKAKAGKDAKNRGLNGDTGDLFGDENDLEGSLEGALEGHKKEKENKKEKKNTPPLSPSGEGEHDRDDLDGLFKPKASKPERGAKKRAPSPSKPKPAKANRRVVTLPDDWKPREDERRVALVECKMASAEFADAVASFREWAGNNGRRFRGDKQPNWDLAFRNHIRRDAASIKSIYRKSAPEAFAAFGDGPAPEKTETPDWWREIEAKFRASEFHASDWLQWQFCEPISRDGLQVIVRARGEGTRSVILHRDAQTNSQTMIDTFENVTGFYVNVLAPQKAQVR